MSAFILLAMGINAQNYSYPDAWGKQGFNLVDSKSGGVQVVYSVPSFSLDNFNANGQVVKEITLPGTFLPNDEGMPNIPGEGRYIAIPQGATPVLNVVSQRTEIIHNVDLVPAPKLPAENDDRPMAYVKNQLAYSTNAFYPAQPVKLSQVQKIRGVDVVMLGVTPFQYNPVTKDLIVYHDLKVNVTFNGGNGHFGDDAYRSRWFDPILKDAIMNNAELPEIDYNKRLQAYNKKSRADEAEYVIITPTGPDFLAWADSIANFRNQQGILSKVYRIDEIGGNTASAIESWIDNAYNTWTIKPVAVMMLGDFGTDPTKNLTSPMMTISGETFPSDHKLGDVDNDDMAEIVFGRIVANNSTQLNIICSKFLNYERDPMVDTSYYQHPITARGWQTERWFQLCSEVVGGYFRTKGKHPVRINEVYQGTPGTIWSSATNTNTVVSYFGPSGLNYIPQSPNQMPCCWAGGSAAQVNAALNDGAFLLQHRDHGEETGWGEPSYHNSNIDQLQNTGKKISFVMSINCLTGKYNWGSECFGERFIRHTKNGANAGALGLVCPSEVSYSFVNDTFVWGMYDNMFPDFMPGYGTTPESRGACPAFGMVAGKYFLQQSSWPYNTGDKRITYYLFHMHGDTFLRLFTEQPQPLTVVHAPEIIQGETTYSVTANLDADIALTVDNQIIGTGIGAGSTPVVITIPPQTAGSMVRVTVTKQNFFRYSTLVPVTLGTLSAQFSASNTNMCPGATVDFTDETTGGATSWNWTFEGGTPATSTVQNPTGINYAASGDYNVTLVVSKTGSADTLVKSAFIHVYEAPVAAFVADEVCVGNPTTFTDQSNGNGSALVWNWNFGDPASGVNNNSTMQNPTHQYPAAGTYSVTLVAANSGCSNEIIQDVVVLTSPEMAATPEGLAELCPNAVSTYTTAGATYATSYEWVITPAEAGTFVGGTTTSELTVSGTYTGAATVKVRGINSCDNGVYSAELPVNIKALAAAPAKPAGSDTVDVHLVATTDFTTAGVANVTSYAWSITPAEAGTIAGTGTTGTVTWNSTYHGTLASISVKGMDDCGAGMTSEIKEVVLKNSVGVDENRAFGIELFPNPAKAQTTLQIIGINAPVDVKIMNTMGDAIYTEKGIQVNGTLSKVIDLTTIAQGVYYVKVETTSGTITKKLVVKK
ncbi:MAG: C25 family cysteine peptidase [Syntrophothermus sp.]